MLGYYHDLPLRGNFFAWKAYVRQDLNGGTLVNRAGEALLMLPDEAVIAVINTLRSELGDASRGMIRAMSRTWGHRAAEKLAEEVGAYYGRPFLQLPLALVTAVLTEAFRHHGWGTVRFDLSHYVNGLIVVEAAHPFEGSLIRATEGNDGTKDEILAGLLAGMMSFFAGRELDCFQTDARGHGASVSRFVITVPERLEGLNSDSPHEQVVAALCATRGA